MLEGTFNNFVLCFLYDTTINIVLTNEESGIIISVNILMKGGSLLFGKTGESSCSRHRCLQL